MSAADPRMTERQKAGWTEAITRLRASGAEVPSESPRCWTLDFADEVRPGRGHHLNAIYNDGEIFAQILMDVYGYPSTSWARFEWEHADSNEECECDFCVAEREEMP